MDGTTNDRKPIKSQQESLTPFIRRLSTTENCRSSWFSLTSMIRLEIVEVKPVAMQQCWITSEAGAIGTLTCKTRWNHIIPATAWVSSPLAVGATILPWETRRSEERRV